MQLSNYDDLYVAVKVNVPRIISVDFIDESRSACKLFNLTT